MKTDYPWVVALVTVAMNYKIHNVAALTPVSCRKTGCFQWMPMIPSPSTVARTTRLYLEKGDDDDQSSNENENPMITREMFQRELLEDPIVKRKRRKKGGNREYKPLDNRDHLPFAVKTITPDPYTHPKVKKAKQKKEKTKKTDLDHMMTTSKLYQKEDDSSTLLGEFKLDKSTTSGDVVVIGGREYRVEKARCQYRYAGGSRFVMVRKILEVKEINRARNEERIRQQFEQSESAPPIEEPPSLE